MAITITLQGENLADCFKQMVGAGAAQAPATASTEQLVEELRRRLRPQGLVVNIDPVPQPEERDEHDPKTNGGDTAAVQATEAPPKRKPGRPPKPTEQAAAPPVEPGQPVSRDELIVALNAYSEAHGGQVAGRQLMQEVTGATRLVDVKPADYGKLLARLTG
jgi:hypothetical protein